MIDALRRLIWVAVLLFAGAGALAYAQELTEELEEQLTDSSYWAPVQVKNVGAETYDDLTLPASSMDLTDPKNVQTVTEYDPETGQYIIRTKMGDVEIATPYMMTGAEYMAYSEQQAMRDYWQKKISEVEHNNERKFDITDMKFNIGPADKVFGPGGVQLKLQGSAELRIGGKLQFIDNPSLTERARRNGVLDFDEKIQVSVNGKVGDKVNFTLNYNTEASFDFDRQNLKLSYKGGEDDIIQSLEAGNVSMDLRSSLITGPQALFGVKTNLKFGKLKVQALLSQQNSESKTVSSSGGAQMTNYEIAVTNYDENRHYFLNYFFRDNYEKAMATLPYIASGVQVTKVEVWITNKKGTYDQTRNILAFIDLGENNSEHFLNTAWNSTGAPAPTNKANTLYSTVTANSAVRNLQESNVILSGLNGMIGGEDFEKVESARLLNSSEYTLNAALGYISLKQALNQDEVLAVAYEYTYAGNVYQVGEFSTDGGENLRAPNALVLKMLKASGSAPTPYNAARKGQHYGTWHLMMKNIYSLGATQVNRDKFELYIMHQNDSLGTSVQYLSESQIKGKQLLRVLSLDRLDQKNNANPDGRFDFIEGYTVIPSNGRIIFPVLEPFGSSLREAIGDDKIAAKYVFQELYDSTLIVAEELSEKNKFYLQGKYQGTNGSQIQLGAMNIPKGSVKVTAGGATLTENVDYTVDYMMGTVTILNQSILDAGTNVDVKLENQSTFSMQRKSLVGAHLEYEFSKDFTLGGTIMHLSERPLTTKVNTGMEPLSNTIWGINGSWKTEFMWLTNVLDKIPWVTATQPSSLTINAEFAHLIPGHTRDVGKAGTAYIDDFEATKTNIDIHYPGYWHLASTPSEFGECLLNDDIQYGKNRALLAWYAVDPIFGRGVAQTPAYIRNNANALSDHRTRIVREPEIFPNRQNLAYEDTRLVVLNLAYYPSERGPYNIVADEIGTDGLLTNPASRWGGIMRKIDNTDFERSNIEYIEFWMMDPFLTNPDPTYTGGDLVIQLGDISEDILKDGKKSFEQGLPVSDLEAETSLQSTVWGRMPRTNSTVTAFSNEAGSRTKQDVGLDGLDSSHEMTFEYEKGGTIVRPYLDYVNALQAKVDATVWNKWANDRFSPRNDPAGDDYHYYRGSDYDLEEVSILDRYKRYNGLEGNSPAMEDATESYGTAATLQPDIEDINSDNTLNEYEKYYSYRISLRPGMLAVGQQHITEKMESVVTLENGEKTPVTWYQFKIPIREYTSKVGAIRNFKAIRFIRLYLTGFREETFLRLATLDLVRGEWRQCTKDLYPVDYPPTTQASLDVQAVNIEENATKTPVNYVLPPGVTRQTDPGQAQLIAQNEQAMVLRVNNLSPRDAKAVYKNTSYDMRNYKRMQMYVHAEMMESIDPDLRDNELTCFIRLGSDMTQNYYEYEIPLTLTPAGIYNNDNENDRAIVWPQTNYFDFPFTALTAAKTARNKAKRQGTSGVSNTIPYTVYDDVDGKPMNRITVMGNPTLEDVENIMIGVRNNSGRVISGEVWVNELRMSEFNEAGGVAAMANASLAVSDIAQVNVAGRLETAGYGSIESNVLSRNMENNYQISVSAAMEGGRLFPEPAKIQMPLYVSYSNQTISPEFDPLDTDIKLRETLETYETKAEKDSVKAISRTVNESTNFSVSNLKVNIHSKKKNMFYDPANFSISASYSKQNQKSPEMEHNVTTDHRGTFNYSYSFNPQPWEPFKDVKSVQNLRWIKELNIYYLPQSWAFSTEMHRTFNHMRMRDFSTQGAGSETMDLTFSKDFMWNRNVDFKYDLTKNIKFSFQSAMNSTIDEGYYTPEIIKDYAFTNDYYEAWKDTIQRSLAHWGSPYTYQQVFTGSVNVPFNRFKSLDWITANGSYNATYNWNATVTSRSEDAVNMGNVISSMQSWQVDGQLNFETLYNKSKYLKDLNSRYSGSRRNRPFKPKTFTQVVSTKAGEPLSVTHRLGSETLNITATDASGKQVKLKVQTDGNNKVNITTKEDCENLSLSIVTKDPNSRTPGQVLGDLGLKFVTMIKRVQVTYRSTNSLVVPGFYPQAGFMGQRKTESGLYAPGFDYAFGFIPNNFMDKAKRNGWLSTDTTVVQPATAARTSDFDIKLTLEPFPNFKIQVNGKRYQASSNSLIYTYDIPQETMTGSFNITQVAIGTAFKRVGNNDDNFHSEVYDQFLANREIMRNRVQERYDNAVYPAAGFITGMPIGGQPYSRSKGTVSTNSADVIIPAFLATYTGRDINKVGFNPFLSILQILPNWSVTYDGLSKLPGIRDHFKSFTITHAYTCKYAIGSYSSYSTWVGAGDGKDKTIGFVRDVETDNPLPSSAYDIASVSLTEQFSPLIGVNMALKNSLTFKAEYRKQRNLALNVTSVQLTEGHTNEFVVGTGYTIKDLSIFYKLKSGEQKKVSNDLKLSLDVSYKDIKTLLRKVEENVTQASSGNRVLAIKFAADYVLSSKINLQLYYDHQGTIPLISSSYPIRSDDFGLSVKLMLTR